MGDAVPETSFPSKINFLCSLQYCLKEKYHLAIARFTQLEIEKQTYQ